MRGWMGFGAAMVTGAVAAGAPWPGSYHRTYGSFASNSPVTDGTRLFAFFGSRGLYAYDLDGTPLWQKDFGVKMRMGHGLRRRHAGSGAGARWTFPPPLGYLNAPKWSGARG